VASGERGAQIASGLQARGLWPATNRDPARMTVLVVTGVTALVRATAKQMSIRGYDFPAQAILPFLADADILHTSNEVAFAADCPPPDWYGEPEGFCSGVGNFQLLQTIGLDVVELTGNHVNDWGTPALSYTLDIYDANGMVYYGGGRDLEDASTPRIVTAPDGTRIAFVGCNVPGPWTAFATSETPGAAPCGDWTAITEAIRALRASGEADLIVATVQYWELPGYSPSAEQVTDFQRLADAGADIVSGSQAHQPQGFAFSGSSFIHYGVGNLFFDQMDYIENRQMFADKHILYGGRHISTVLFTGLNEAWAQPNPMTPEDRAAFLQTIFEASGW
jgi:poly-gamma-glutamate synthesis protein (capsule biosynthesis protein)